MRMTVTKRIEFDTGHRVPNHNSKCRNLHGHRYVLEATLEGEVAKNEGQSDAGMVLDFGDIKREMMALVHDKYDHALVLWDRDPILEHLRAASEDLEDFLDPQHRGLAIVEVPFIPTAEELAAHIYGVLDEAFKNLYDRKLVLVKVRLYETPGSWADAFGPR